LRALVDSCVWSQALRRQTGDRPRDPRELRAVAQLAELIRARLVVVLGPIRQEVLSGIRAAAQFEQVRARLRAFPDLPLGPEDFELAAQHWNRCQRKGVQGSHTDFLLCAAAERHALGVLTLDRDFERFHRVLGTRLLTG